MGSESKEDASATFSMEPIVAYLDDLDCNNPAENKGEWALMKMLLLIILYDLRMYLNMSTLVPCACLCPSQKWHVCMISKILHHFYALNYLLFVYK